MDFIIVTGLSGAGKSRTIAAMEDIGFYCVDNLPPMMIPVFYDLCANSENMPRKIAVVVDTRGGELFKSLFGALKELENKNRPYKILFLDAKDSALVNRYQETRRKHPLAETVNGSLENAVKLERQILKPFKECATYVIDTSNIKVADLKTHISKLFLGEINDIMVVHCISFGFKHGIPSETDLMFDVRCLTNPFYVDELRPLTGLDKAVYDYVMDAKEAKGLLERLINLIDYLIPLYQKEGKSQLVIAIGCTGGHHRSVAFAKFLQEHIANKKIKSTITHRDITK